MLKVLPAQGISQGMSKYKRHPGGAFTSVFISAFYSSYMKSSQFASHQIIVFSAKPVCLLVIGEVFGAANQLAITWRIIGAKQECSIFIQIIS